jgi:hypothetical protein
LGLYYNRARYLDVNRGRFWTQDTFEGDIEEPLSLHKYLYGNGNPVGNVDPSGNVTVGQAITTIEIGFILNAFVKFALTPNLTNAEILAYEVATTALGFTFAKVISAAFSAASKANRGASFAGRVIEIIKSGKVREFYDSEKAALKFLKSQEVEVVLSDEGLEFLSKAVNRGGSKIVDFVGISRSSGKLVLTEAKTTLTAKEIKEIVDGKIPGTIETLSAAYKKASEPFEGVEELIITYEKVGNLLGEYKIVGEKLLYAKTGEEVAVKGVSIVVKQVPFD